MKKLRTKVQAGDNVFFRSMEGEVYTFLEKDIKNKTFGIDFYSDGVYLEFKSTKSGYKVISSNSPKWLINKVYKPKEFTILFRPGTGRKVMKHQLRIEILLTSIINWSGPDRIKKQAIELRRLMK